MKKYFLILFLLFFFVWLNSQDSPTKKDVEQCLINNLKECLTTKVLSFKILDIDSNMAKVEFTLYDPVIYYLKLIKENQTWVISECSRDKNLWMKIEKFYEGVNEECKRRNEKIEKEKKRKIEKEKMRKENPQRYTLSYLKTICMAILDYETDNGKIPEASSIEELAKIISPFYIRICPLQDAWEENFIYQRINNKKFFIISKGPDKKENTADDIIIDQDGIIKKSKQK